MQPKEIAELAWYSLHCHDIKPVPENYRLWYLHHTGADIRLTERITDMVARGARFDDDCMNLLVQTFAPETPDRALVRESSTKLHALAGEMRADAEAGATATRHFGASLRDASANLDSAGLEKIRAAAAAEHARNEELQTRLRAAESQISELRHTLDEAERAASIDPLTGLVNRRRFDSALAEQLAESQRHGTPFTLIMADIDHFKNFNDRFGHQTGDLVLRAVARTLREAVKGRDCVARHGGEEFALILVGAEIAGGRVVAESIRTALGRRRLVNRAKGETLGVITMSLGVTQHRPGDTQASIVERADQAMYRAKRNGRNRVEADAVPMFAHA